MNGAPDPHERPLTVTMARTAAKVSAFGDPETGELAFALLDKLRPHISNQDISGKPPPPQQIRELALAVQTGRGDTCARLSMGRTKPGSTDEVKLSLTR